MYKPGPGPGETRRVIDFDVDEEHLYLAEASLGLIHQYDHDFHFQRDIRIAKGGKMFRIDKDHMLIWGIRQKDENLTLATVYRMPDFTEVATFMRMPAEERPLGVGGWGGFCKVGPNRYAAMFVHRYKIYFFDGAFQPLGAIPKQPPKHHLPYFPIKLKQPGRYGPEVGEWQESWHAMMRVFFYKNHFLINYALGPQINWDLLDQEGNLILNGQSPTGRYSYFGGDLLWRVDVQDTDGMNHFRLIADRITLPKP